MKKHPISQASRLRSPLTRRVTSLQNSDNHRSLLYCDNSWEWFTRDADGGGRRNQVRRVVGWLYEKSNVVCFSKKWKCRQQAFLGVFSWLSRLLLTLTLSKIKNRKHFFSSTHSFFFLPLLQVNENHNKLVDFHFPLL